MEFLPSLLFCSVIGMLLGNFSTTFLYRMPKKIEISGINTPPMCSGCHVELRFYQFLPPMSWVFRKCKICGYKASIFYTGLEVAGLLGSAILFLLFGLSESYILLLLYYIVNNLSVATLHSRKNVNGRLLSSIIAIGVIHSVGQNCSIFPVFFNAFIASIFVLRELRDNKKSDLLYSLFISAAWLPLQYFLLSLPCIALISKLCTEESKKLEVTLVLLFLLKLFSLY